MTDGTCSVQFSDVYGDVDSQYKAVKMFKTALIRRDVYLDLMEKSKHKDGTVCQSIRLSHQYLFIFTVWILIYIYIYEINVPS